MNLSEELHLEDDVGRPDKISEDETILQALNPYGMQACSAKMNLSEEGEL